MGGRGINSAVLNRVCVNLMIKLSLLETLK